MKNNEILFNDANLLMNLKCQKKTYFRNIANSNKKNINYYMQQMIEEEVKHTNYVYKDDIYRKIKDKGGDIILEEQANDQSIVINRFKDYMISNNIQYITKITDIVEYLDKKVLVSAHVFINLNTGVLIFSKIKNRQSDISKSSKTNKAAEDNVELFMLSLLIDQYVDKLNIKYRYALPAIIFLRHKDDRGNYYAFFENNKGDNIIYSNKFSQYAVEQYIKGSTLVDIKKAKLIDEDTCKICSFKSICNNKDYSDKLSFNNYCDKNKENVDKIKKVYPPTKEQAKAINFNKGIARVNAGAGTGKTYIIINRIIRLVKEGADPSKILLITFTNKGADEMKQRLEKSNLPKKAIDKITIETFNSLGDKILKENYRDFGFTKEPKLIDKIDHFKIIIKILENNDTIEGLNYKHPFLSFRNAKGAVIRLSDFFNIFKSENIRTPAEFYEKELFLSFLLNSEKKLINTGYDMIGRIFYLYLQYNTILKNKNLIDFQDQITKICDGIDRNNKVLNKMFYEHIIIDEYQDTDLNQLKIVKFFVNKKENKSLMVVGDDSQSIFSFRGAKPEIMINFHQYFDNVQDIFITENFRSTNQIVNLANKINEFNTQKIDKKLYSNKKGEQPKLLTGNIFDIVDFNKVFDDNNKCNETTAIITRTNAELIMIKKELDKINIPNIIEAPLIKNPNVLLLKQIILFLIDHEQNTGIFNYLYLKDENFKKESIENKEKILKSYIDELRKEVPIGYSLFNEKGDKINSYSHQIKILNKFVEKINDLELTLFFEELKEEFTDIQSMYKYLHEMFVFSDRRTIQNFIKYKGIILSTAHSSKGREFDNVYIITDKFKPISNKEEHVNEEVRLFFVAITRAKKKLTIISSQGNDFFYYKLNNLYIKNNNNKQGPY